MTSRAVSYSRTAAAVPFASEALWVLVMVSVVLALPPVIYAWLSYAQFGLFKPSYYLPYEALFDALRSADAEAILAAPVLSVNMTSGELLANMYNLTVGQFFLSVALGIVMGLALAAQLSFRKACAVGSVGGTAAAAGSGLMATLAASSTGILGCCGSALSGGILALAGVSATTASQIAEFSPWIQVAMIVFFAFAYVRLSRRLKVLATS
ncbi:MAG: hypothetical protein IID50_02505 [Proteobacteria bacterium]|nr:hypothetical protein [Pseudomonadota bacterium]